MTNNEFLSIENKRMVWQLLLDNGGFNDIPESNFNNVKNLYERKLIEISNITNNNLIEKNKLIIHEMINNLSYLKKKELPKPLEEVKIQVNKDFENKQEEFFRLVKKPNPEEIKFQEENDEPLDKNIMDKMLSDISKEREKYLRDDELISINKKDIMENNTTENIQKRVSFETTNYDFISKLKKIDKNNSNYKIEEDSTNNMLNKILSNQEMIIQLLNNIVRKE
tara:strand:+ start:1832 stop:2503 length:672 start_codon:yes stop_codon:yes gene_type:complete